MERKKLICIGCPKGCELTVFWMENRSQKVEGNHCKKVQSMEKRSNSSDQDRDEHCYGAGR